VPHICVIDGSNLLFRAFYGNPAVGRAFKEAGAITPEIEAMFVGNARAMLRRIVRECGASHLLFAKDSAGGSFRGKIYPEYKAGRRRTGPSAIEMTRILEPWLDRWGVAQVAALGFEADDVVATVARRARRRGSRVTVISGDRDLLQLVRLGVEVLLPIPGKGDVDGESFIRETLRIRPDQIADYKAMLGDASDNIPRIEIDSGTIRGGKAIKEGVKEAEALGYLERYGDLRGLYKALAASAGQADDPFSARERRWLEAGKTSAFRFKRLVRLRFGVPLPGLDPAATSTALLDFAARPEPPLPAAGEPAPARSPAPAPAAQMSLGL
jgi:DNA polymerase I